MKNKVGWIFLGYFAYSEKGPCLFWEKEWKSIDSQKYCGRIVPLIDGMVSMRPRLSVIPDNPPAHAAASTMEELSQRLIQSIISPLNSPDLNPIGAVWDRMKDCIQPHYPNLGCGKKRTQDSLPKIVKESQDSVSPKNLVRLNDGMPARRQAVLDTDGEPTRH